MNKLLRLLFYQAIIRPVIYILLGLNIKHRDRLPQKGPAILVANHNSHLDTMVLMSLFPWKLQKIIFPVAAADYFLKNKWLTWFSKKIVGIIPITRQQSSIKKNPLADLHAALINQQIIIFYPEGSRGNPEELTEIKRGIAHLAKQNPRIPIYPIYLYGLGKSLPKNEALLVPFIADVIIGTPIFGKDHPDNLVETLKSTFRQLQDEVPKRIWEQ